MLILNVSNSYYQENLFKFKFYQEKENLGIDKIGCAKILHFNPFSTTTRFR